MPSAAQPVEFVPNAKKTFKVTMSPATDIAGWTFILTIRQNGTSMFSTTTVTVNDSDNGVFSISMTATQTGTLGLGYFDYDIWRTNSTAETQLVIGPLTGTPQYRV